VPSADCRYDGDSNTDLAGDHSESDSCRCSIRNQFRTGMIVMDCDRLVDRAGLDVCTNHSETPAQPWSPWVSKADSRPLLTAACPNHRVTVTFESESSLGRQAGRRLSPTRGPSKRQSASACSPGLWTTVRTRRGGKPSSHDACADQAWPTAPMDRKSTPSWTDSPAVATGSMQDLK
jgi:hypothetical protein